MRSNASASTSSSPSAATSAAPGGSTQWDVSPHHAASSRASRTCDDLTSAGGTSHWISKLLGGVFKDADEGVSLLTAKLPSGDHEDNHEGGSFGTVMLPGTDAEDAHAVYSTGSGVGADLLGRSFTIEEINAATDGLDIKNILSGFGPSVFRGIHGLFGSIAVSSFLKSDVQEYIEGMQRCAFRSKRMHPNVASPIGYCSDERFHVIYEFQYMYSLKKKLEEDSGESKDVLVERLKIALDVVKGLKYITDGDTCLKLPKLTSEMVWLRENGTAVIVDMCGNGTGVVTDMIREFGQMMTEIVSPSFSGEGHEETSIQYHKLAEDCCFGDSKLLPSFESVIKVLDRLVCMI